ncbi:hypothetical protein HYQ46_009040 [Verticillium longisporum]|nr:hypothetical protein HYQ46_009040 [Verticillium longisporum]
MFRTALLEYELDPQLGYAGPWLLPGEVCSEVVRTSVGVVGVGIGSGVRLGREICPWAAAEAAARHEESAAP